MALLPFACGEKKLITSSSKKVSPVAPQALGIRSQVDPTADGSRLQLDGPVAAVPISLQDATKIGEKEDVRAGIGPAAPDPVQDGRSRRGIPLPSKAPGY